MSPRVGMMSMTRSSSSQRQTGAPSRESSLNPSPTSSSRRISDYSPRFTTLMTTSTSFVCRELRRPDEVINSSVTAPPRNTSRSRNGAIRSTTRISIATLSETPSATDQPREMLRGEIPFPGPPATQCIDQTQAPIELGVGSGCGGGRRIQRLKRLPPCLTLGIGPDGDRVEPGVDQVGKRRGGMGRWHALRLAAPDGRKGIPHTMQCGNSRPFLSMTTSYATICRHKGVAGEAA